MTFTLNVLPNSPDPLPTLQRLGARWCLVMDNHGLALRLAGLGYRVIYRAFSPNDARWHEVMTPAEWLNQHRRLAAPNVWLQVFNEPVINDTTQGAQFVRWISELRALNPPPLALCNFSVGNPHEGMIVSGVFDEIIRGWRRQDVFGVHEYAQKAGDIEAPWKVGRYAYWRDRFRALGVPVPQFVATENGFDKGGGYGDGHRNHISEAQYIDLLQRIAAVYKRDGVHACVYSFGRGFGWDSFDIQGSEGILNAMAAINASTPTTPAPVEWKARILVLKGSAPVNFRATPNGAVIRKIEDKSTKVDFAQTVNGWHHVRVDGTAGYVAASVADIDDIPAAPDGYEVQLPKVWIRTKEQAELLAQTLIAVGEAIRAQAK